MPILIPRGNKVRVINEFLRLAQAWIFPNCAASAKAQLVAHLEWMRQQEDGLIVACRFETSTDSRRTRIIFEAYFEHQVKDGIRNVAMID